MQQFAIYRNGNSANQKAFPYLLNIQSNLLRDLSTVLVIPLAPARAFPDDASLTKLHFYVDVDGDRFVAVTSLLASISKKMLGARAADLSHRSSEIVNAFDFLISGI